MTSSIEFACSGEQAAQRAVDGLTRRGFHVVRSFDWNVASHGACDCPHHGTARCTCQYVVLLVYDLSGPPAVVTAHSRDDRSHVEVVADPNAPPDPQLVDQIVSALAEAGGTFAGLSCAPAADTGAPAL